MPWLPWYGGLSLEEEEGGGLTSHCVPSMVVSRCGRPLRWRRGGGLEVRFRGMGVGGLFCLPIDEIHVRQGKCGISRPVMDRLVSGVWFAEGQL